MKPLKVFATAVIAASLLASGSTSPATAATPTPAAGPAGDFSWEGFNWKKRVSAGAPMFNGSWNSANVVNPDINGDVKLKITNPTGTAPAGAEMFSTREGFGYGTYTITVEKNLAQMQDEIVWGCLFTYDPNAQPGMNEIDLCEASSWGGPWDVTQGHGYWFDAAAGVGSGNSVVSFPVPVSTSQTHSMVWEKGKLTFYTFAGSNTSAPLAKKTVLTGATVPVPAKERVHFNLWAVGGNGGEPATVTPEEVKITSFVFTPGAAAPEIIQSPIAEKATLLNGRLGSPVGSEVKGQKDGGSYQEYTNGTILWSPITGAYYNWHGIRDEWKNRGGINGVYGYPITDEYFFNTSTVQDYQTGSIFWSEARGITAVHGVVHTKWKASGSQAGLGVPTGNQTSSVKSGVVQKFEQGTIYWSPSTNAQVVKGVIAPAYQAASAERGLLGYPKGNMATGLKNGGSRQQFEGGYIYSSPTTNAWIVKGKIFLAWNAKSAQGGVLGYPIAAEYTVTNGVAQKFQGGTITYNKVTGTSTIKYK